MINEQPIRGWIKVSERHAPLYTDILVLCSNGFVGVGQYMAHGTYTHSRYPVLGQCKATHWQPLPPTPDEEADAAEYQRVTPMITLEDRSEETRDKMLYAMMDLTQRMRTGYVESFIMHNPENGDSDNYEISVSIRLDTSSPERTT